MRSRHWHGINAVALSRLARHDHINITVPFDFSGLAETIRDEVKRAQTVNDDNIDIWAAANAMEASIALRDWEGAYFWAKKYADPKAERASKIDAFEVAGTLRQLEEVWRLNVKEEPGSLLLPLLRTRLQDLEGFNFEVMSAEPISQEFLLKQADSLERQFGGQFLSFRTYCDGVSRGRSVARIGPSAEEHVGTGFLIEGGDLDKRLAGQRLMLTCDHVISNTNVNSLNPGRAIITFRAEDNSIQKFGVESVLWSSPEGDLDVSILRLDGDTGKLPVVPWAQHPLGEEEQRVLIFGHAVGGALSFSLGDNRLVDRNERFLQYRAPTVSGSSGSPVFNLDWELVAVHHRGGYSMKRLTGEGVHEANQGSSVFALRDAVVRNPQQLFAQ
jgi:S1-C subfamily serine protease